MLHCRIPVLGFSESRHFDAVGQTLRYDVYFEKDELLGSFEWKSLSRSYLEECPQKISLVPLFSQYHKLITEFHIWLSNRLSELHREHLKALEAMETELRAIADRERSIHQVGGHKKSED